MRVYLELPTQSRGIRRVRDMLVKYKPESVEVVDTPKDAELEIIHVIGRHDSVELRIELLRRAQRPYAMIQYVIRSSMKPHTMDWVRMWENSRLVWSYYDLYALMDEDNTPGEFPFLHAPLGVDTDIFYDKERERDFIIFASSQHALAEGARECAFAAKAVNMKMFFLGHELRRGDDVVCKSNLSDEAVANYYSRSEFVSGLRRIEGFELPVIEGLMCGARPIVYDKPHYRRWFNNFAIFIPEGTREEVIDSLIKIFKEGAEPITEKEKILAKDMFNWQTIIGEFWKRLL